MNKRVVDVASFTEGGGQQVYRTILCIEVQLEIGIQRPLPWRRRWTIRWTREGGATRKQEVDRQKDHQWNADAGEKAGVFGHRLVVIAFQGSPSNSFSNAHAAVECHEAHIV